MADLKLDGSNDEPHEMMVRDYLSAQLDGQLGGAEARFRSFLQQEQSAPAPRDPWYLPNRFRGWTFGVVGAALAASLAALWAGPSLQPVLPQKPGVVSPTPPRTMVNDPVLVEQDVQSQTIDDGPVMIDADTAARVIHRRDLQRTRWFDEDQNLRGEQVVPQDHLVYVQMKTY
jgi:hypothetical protein